MEFSLSFSGFKESRFFESIYVEILGTGLKKSDPTFLGNWWFVHVRRYILNQHTESPPPTWALLWITDHIQVLAQFSLLPSLHSAWHTSYSEQRIFPQTKPGFCLSGLANFLGHLVWSKMSGDRHQVTSYSACIPREYQFQTWLLYFPANVPGKAAADGPADSEVHDPGLDLAQFQPWRPFERESNESYPSVLCLGTLTIR